MDAQRLKIKAMSNRAGVSLRDYYLSMSLKDEKELHRELDFMASMSRDTPYPFMAACVFKMLGDFQLHITSIAQEDQ